MSDLVLPVLIVLVCMSVVGNVRRLMRDRARLDIARRRIGL